jgi:hypothetical protein
MWLCESAGIALEYGGGWHLFSVYCVNTWNKGKGESEKRQ